MCDLFEARQLTRMHRRNAARQLYVKAEKQLYASTHKLQGGAANPTSPIVGGDLYVDALIARAARRQIDGDLADAKYLLELAVTTNCALKGIAYFYLASIQRMLGENANARTSLENSILNLNPDHKNFLASAHNNLGDLCSFDGVEQEDASTAIRLFSDAVESYGRALALADVRIKPHVLYGRGVAQALQAARLTSDDVDHRIDLIKLASDDLSEANRILTQQNGKPDHEEPCLLALIQRERGTLNYLLNIPRDASEMWKSCLETTNVNSLRKIAHKISEDFGEPAVDHEYRLVAAVVAEKLRILGIEETKLAKMASDSNIAPPSRAELYAPDRNVLEWIPQPETILGGVSKRESLFQKVTQVSADVYSRYIGTDNTPIEVTKYSLENGKYTTAPRSILTVLRGWGSAVPMITTDDDVMHGGGYFLRIGTNDQGVFGVAIDPGFGFTRNFLQRKIHLMEIDAVVVSHNHPDHNLDLWTFDNVRYELFSRRTNDAGSDALKEFGKSTDSWPYDLYLDAESESWWKSKHPDLPGKKTKDRYSDWKHVRRSILLSVPEDESRFNFKGRPTISRSVKLTKSRKNLKVEIGLKHFAAPHSTDIKGGTSLIFDLKFDRNRDNDRKLLKFGYTGDTQWREHLPEQQYFGDCDLLLAHMSQPDASELINPRQFKDYHLGYSGMIKLIVGCAKTRKGLKKPAPLILVGEFWGGKGDFRLAILEAVREQSEAILRSEFGEPFDPKVMPTVLPAGIDLTVDVETLQVKCSAPNCGLYTDHDQITVAPSDKHFGRLKFLCPNCYNQLRHKTDGAVTARNESRNLFSD